MIKKSYPNNFDIIEFTKGIIDLLEKEVKIKDLKIEGSFPRSDKGVKYPIVVINSQDSPDTYDISRNEVKIEIELDITMYSSKKEQLYSIKKEIERVLTTYGFTRTSPTMPNIDIDTKAYYMNELFFIGYNTLSECVERIIR